MTAEASRSRFRQHVTRSAFILSLSDVQIQALNNVVRGSSTDWSSISGLERRGLIDYIPSPPGEDPWKTQARFEPTSIGRLVHQLLVEAEML